MRQEFCNAAGLVRWQAADLPDGPLFELQGVLPSTAFLVQLYVPLPAFCRPRESRPVPNANGFSRLCSSERNDLASHTQ